MDEACRNLLGELRLSRQHRLPYQFPAGYNLLTSPRLVAEASRQAGSTAASGTYTAARVKSYGTEAPGTWVTTDPDPVRDGARRWVVERTFAWLACFRRVVFEYEFTPASHVAWLLLANSTMSLNRV